MANEFQRSNLTIQPKQRLMSAGSFINPVRTYDANEQMRIMESFRGLSAQSDALIDSLIKKKQEDGQKKADEYMTDAMLDPNHPDHRQAKDMMNGLKPQVANLLGVDYWTQQYINKAQAEQIIKKEEYEMLDAVNKYANLSPDEFRVKLGEIRAKTDSELATYPQGVRDNFVRMPRRELTDRIRDEHYKGIMKEQLNTRDTIFVNKASSTLDGLFDEVYNTPDLEDENLNLIDYENYEKTLTDKAAKEEIDRVALINDWQGQKDRAGYFIPIDYKADILQYRKLSQSPVVEKVLSNMREYAEAGARPGEIKEKIYEAFTKFVTDDDYLGDDAAVLFNIIMDKANKDSVLQKEAGSWNYTSKTGNDQDIALFDMTDVTAKGKQLRQLALQSGNLKRAEYETEQAERKRAVWKFLSDAELSGKIKRADIFNKTSDELGQMFGLNHVEDGEAIEEYRQFRIKGMSNPVNEEHIYQYNDWLGKIRRGVITTQAQIDRGRKAEAFHPNHYKDLLNELENGKTLTANQEKLKNELEQNVMRYLRAVYPNDQRKVETLFLTFQNDIYERLVSGDITNIVNGNEFLAKSYAIRGLDNAQHELHTNEPLSTPQTQQEYQEGVAKRMSAPGVISENEKTGEKKVVHQGWFNPYQTYDEWRAGQGQELKDQYPYMSEEALRKMYNDQQGYFENFKDEEKQKYLASIVNREDLSPEGLVYVWNINPDIVQKKFGQNIEVVLDNGMVVPKDEHLKQVYKTALKNYYGNVNKAIEIVSFIKYARLVNLPYLRDQKSKINSNQ